MYILILACYSFAALFCFGETCLSEGYNFAPTEYVRVLER